MAEKAPSISTVLSVIKATVISNKDGILKSQLDADYRELTGEAIPYSKLGYNSLSELIACEKSLTTQVRGGQTYVIAVESKSSHVANLIAGQKKQPAKKKRSSHVQKMFHLNTPRPYKWKDGGQGSRRGRSSWRGSRGSKAAPPVVMNPSSSSQVSQSKMPDYHRPRPRSTRPPLLPTPGSARSPLLHSPPMEPLSTNQHVSNGVPERLDSGESYDDYEDEEFFEECAASLKPSIPKPFAAPKPQIPPLIPTRQSTPKPSSVSFSARPPSVSPAPPSPLLPPAPPTTSLPFTLPSAPIPVPVNLNESEVNSNGYRRNPKMSGKAKRASSTKLASIVDNSEAKPGSFTEAFLDLVRSNVWSYPEYLLLPRITTKSREVYASTVSGTAILFNSTNPVSYDFSTFPDEYNNPEESKEAVSKKALEGMIKKLEESKKVAPVSKNLELIINRVLSIVLPHPNGLWAFSVDKFYKDKYQEQLPDGWMDDVSSPNGALIAEKLAEFSYVIRVNPGSAPSNTDLKKLDVMALGELEYPPTPTWDVFITTVVSPSEVWFRFVGAEYSAWYDEVVESMSKHYSDWQTFVAPDLEVGAVYAYPGPELVARVELLRIDGSEAIVRHVDHGDIEVVPRSHLCVLDLNFRDLPPQALRASAKDLEPYAHREETTLLFADRAQGQVLVAVPTFSENSDPPISLVLHDTSGEDPININELVIETLKLDVWNEPTLCEVGSFSNVTVTSVWKTGDIYCQVTGEGLAWLAAQLADLPESEFRPATAAEISPDSLYVVRHSAGYLRRVQPIALNQRSDKVDICYIDFGDVGSVSIAELVPLDYLSPLLCKIPKQAVRLSLSDIPGGERAAKHIMKLIPTGTSAMAKVIKPADSTNPFYVVDLYIRNANRDIISVNATVVVGEDTSDSIPSASESTNDDSSPPESTLEAAASILVQPLALRRPGEPPKTLVDSFKRVSIGGRERTISQAQTPSYGEFFDIYIVSVANPSNFTVIPWKYMNELNDLQERLTNFYSHLPNNSAEYKLTEYYNGFPCAIQHSDGYWYRAVVERVLPVDGTPQLLVRFCDFGNMTMSSLSGLRRLKDEFMKIPGLGFRASLADIKPLYRDWEVDDCVRATMLLMEKPLTSIIKGSVITEGVSTLLLQVFDTNSKEDIDIGELFVSEGRAVPHN